jgi:hypothetical protein
MALSKKSQKVYDLLSGKPDPDGFVRQYLATALWAETGDDEQPLDDKYDISDIADASVEQAIADCARFREENEKDLAGWDEEQAAHDFWLTRHGHGAGFWDRDFGDEKARKRLTDAAQKFREITVVEGGDGKLYIE